MVAAIGAAGAIVIDNSSCWRYDEVPLIVPEVNAAALVDYMGRPNRRNIIANPNCSTAQLVVVLKPLHDLARIKRVVVATYQSVSGAGKDAMDELWNQTKGIFVTDPPEPKSSPSRSPSTSFRMSTCSWISGDTREEWKMTAETRRSSIPRSSSPQPACGCRCSSAIRRR